MVPFDTPALNGPGVRRICGGEDETGFLGSGDQLHKTSHSSHSHVGEEKPYIGIALALETMP